MKRLVILASLLLMLSLLVGACTDLMKADHLKAIQKAGVIKVGTATNNPPFESVDASGNKLGLDIDLMNEVAKRLGVTVKWVDLPSNGLIPAVQEGTIDAAIAALNSTEKRDKVVDFSDVYYSAEDAFTVIEGFKGTITKPEDLTGYKVAVQTGTAQDSWLTDDLVSAGKFSEENLFRYDRIDQAMHDLQNSRIDVVLSDYKRAQTLVEQLGGLKIIYHGAGSSAMRIVIPEGDKNLQQAINDILKQLQDEGFIDQLVTKYSLQ